MTVAQTISGFAPAPRSIKQPLDYLNSKLTMGNESRGLLGKLVGGISRALSGAFEALGNLFGSGDGRIGCWEAFTDKCTEWYRAYQDTEFKDWFKRKKEGGAMVHPE